MFCSAAMRRGTTTVLLLSLAMGCGSRTSRRPLERVVIAPFENLSDKPDWDWLGHAIPSALAMTRGSASRVWLPVGREEQNPLLRATQVLQGYYTFSGGGLHLHAVLRDPQTQKTLHTFDSEGALANAGALVGDMAKQLGIADLPGIGTAELEAFGKALSAGNPEAQLGGLRQALGANPSFTPALVLEARLLATQGNRDQAVSLLRTAREKAATPWAASQMRLLEAQLSGDRAQQRAALEAMLRESPAQTDAMRQLATLLLLDGAYGDAARWLQKSAALEPELVANWNMLAYAQAYALEFDQARRAVSEYRKLAPDDPNAADTAGEIAWMSGDFRQAEAMFLEAQAKSPGFLSGMEFYRAALARFLSGDTAGADGLFSRYEESRRAANDSLLAAKQAHWLMLTGRMKQGQEKAAEVAAAAGEPASRAATLLAFTFVQEGQRQKAGELLRMAVAKSQAPAALAGAASVAFLAQAKASPAEWQQRADRSIQPQAGPRFRAIMLFYAAILDQLWPEAIQTGETLLRQTEPGQADELRLLTGLAYLQTGRHDRARQFLRRTPLPPAIGDALFATLYFPGFRNWQKQAGL